MRILYAGTIPPHQGGSATSSWGRLQALASRGHEIHVIAPSVESEAVPEEVATRDANIEIETFPMPYHATEVFSTFDDGYRDLQRRQVLSRLERAFGEKSYDVVWIGREGFAPGVAELVWRRQVPWTVFLHGIMKPITNGTFGDPRYGALLLESCRKADWVFPVARHLAEDLARVGFENVTAISNGVDVDRFAPRPDPTRLRAALKIPPDAPVVLHVSNFKPVKCIADIVDAAVRVAAVHPDLHIVLVGDGGERGPMMARAAAGPASQRFRFPGWIRQSALPDYYALADVFVLASSTEVSPMVLLEAMSCETAVVAADVPATREIVADGQDGVIYPHGDVDALAHAILRLLGNADRRRELAVAARQKVRARHDLSIVVGDIEAGLERLNGAGARRTVA